MTWKMRGKRKINLKMMTRRWLTHVARGYYLKNLGAPLPLDELIDNSLSTPRAFDVGSTCAALSRALVVFVVS